VALASVSATAATVPTVATIFTIIAIRTEQASFNVTMFCDVWEKCKFTCSLYSGSNLALMTTACACDPTAAKLAAVRDELAQGGDVTPIDMFDLVLAVGA